MQVSALIYTMGRETEHVLKSFTLAEGDDSQIGVILAKVDEHFVLKRKIIQERARFHLRNQNQGDGREWPILCQEALSSLKRNPIQWKMFKHS